MLQPFSICGNLDARYMHKFHHRSVSLWAPIENWGSTWDIILCRLSSTWSHLLEIYLQTDMLIVYLMMIIFRH
jgi:hypothetical protein